MSLDIAVLETCYSIAYFTPTIVQALQYGVVQTQLHAVPPMAAGFVFAIILAWASDKVKLRSPFIFFGLALLITGLSILISIQGNGKDFFSTRYGALCLTAMGALGIGGHIICWYVMNLQGHTERSIGSAWLISIGNTGGILAAFSFEKKDAPLFRTGYSICLAMATLCVVSCTCYGLLIRQEMRRTQDAKQRYIL
jgi:peptidoglycan/LPS O-acetylase OafA/YrhL